MAFASLDCDRVSVELRLAASHERASVLQRELRDALQKQLAAQLGAFGGARDDGAQIFIDRLEVEAVSGTWDMDALVRDIVARIARSLWAQIDAGHGLRFRNRVDFLAAFLVALADGSAWNRWCFSEFDGLKPLGASNAIRTAVLIEKETGWQALGSVTASSLRQILGVLKVADAARMLAALRARPVERRACFEVLWRESGFLSDALEVAPGEWLRALLVCEHQEGGSAGETSLRALLGMRWLRAIPPGVWIDRGADRSPRETVLEQAARYGGDTEWVAALDEVQARAVLDELSRRAPDGVHSRLATPWGGCFLLMMRLARLGWCAGWRDLLSDEVARELALAIVATALDPRRSRRIAEDPLLMTAFDIGDGRALARQPRCRRALESICGTAVSRGSGRGPGAIAGGVFGARLRQAAALLLEDFAAKLPGLSGSSAAYLRDNLLTLGATVEVGEHEVGVSLGRAPLDVILTLAGVKRGTFSLPGRDFNLRGQEHES